MLENNQRPNPSFKAPSMAMMRPRGACGANQPNPAAQREASPSPAIKLPNDQTIGKKWSPTMASVISQLARSSIFNPEYADSQTSNANSTVTGGQIRMISTEVGARIHRRMRPNAATTINATTPIIEAPKRRFERKSSGASAYPMRPKPTNVRKAPALADIGLKSEFTIATPNSPAKILSKIQRSAS